MNQKQKRDHEYQQAESFGYDEERDYLEQTLEQVKKNPTFMFYVNNDRLGRHLEEDDIQQYVEELNKSAYESFSEKYGSELAERFQQALVACALAELRRMRFEPYLKIAWVFTPEACSEDVCQSIERFVPKC